MVKGTATRLPSAELAAAIAGEVTGCAPVVVRRFTTGARHHVFDVDFIERPSVAVRIGLPSARSEMEGAVYLSGLLRPRGVKLPAIIAEDVGAEFPWLLLERFPGTDLGAVINSLSTEELERIAAAVTHAQAVTAKSCSARRYGYGVRPEQAPHARWSEVLDANLGRSHRRMISAGLFDVGLVGSVRAALDAIRDYVDAIPPTAFLHDTTTRNVIVAGGALSGIVDVDDLCFGDPRYPAALTLAVLMAYGGPVQYVSAWLRHAGQREDRGFWLYVSVFILDLMAEHGQVFNGNERPSSPAVRAALRRAFDENLVRVRGS